MTTIETIIVSIALAMDCFAVALGIGTTQQIKNARPVFRISFHFGLFQGGMTLLGWLLGSTVVSYISNLDHWLALILLAWVGVRMIIGGLKKEAEKEDEKRGDPTRGATLIILSIATSIDAMAVGLSMAMLNVNILLSSLAIGFTSILFGLVGMLAGNKLSERFGKKMEILGGIILLIIGLRILFSHLFAP